jgi:5'(3')-deoxyribonucleotidase
MREIAAEWTGQDLKDLPVEPVWGLSNWGIPDGWYERFHRYAVTQRDLFRSMMPIEHAPQALRRLSTEGVRIRIVTHRLYVRYFHQTAVAQTVEWLDQWGIPYWDLCFMAHKSDVGADLYVEDSPENIADLHGMGKSVVILSNATNRHVDATPGSRAENWVEAEQQIRESYWGWLDVNGLERPSGPGVEPQWSKDAINKPDL